MTKKEMKNLAKEIAKAEMLMQNPESSKDEIAWAKNQILYLSNKISSPDELFKIDELVALYIEK